MDAAAVVVVGDRGGGAGGVSFAVVFGLRDFFLEGATEGAEGCTELDSELEISSLDEDCSACTGSSSSVESNASGRFFCTRRFLGTYGTHAAIMIFFSPFMVLLFLKSTSDTSVACTFSANISGLGKIALLTKYCGDNVIKLEEVTYILFISLSNFAFGFKMQRTAALTVSSSA